MDPGIALNISHDYFFWNSSVNFFRKFTWNTSRDFFKKFNTNSFNDSSINYSRFCPDHHFFEDCNRSSFRNNSRHLSGSSSRGFYNNCLWDSFRNSCRRILRNWANRRLLKFAISDFIRTFKVVSIGECSMPIIIQEFFQRFFKKFPQKFSLKIIQEFLKKLIKDSSWNWSTDFNRNFSRNAEILRHYVGNSFKDCHMSSCVYSFYLICEGTDYARFFS